MNENMENEKLKEVIHKQDILSKKTMKMKDDILDNNSEYIEKMAKNNYLDFQKKELEKLIKNLEQKRQKENEIFNQEIKSELDKIKDCQKESKISFFIITIFLFNKSEKVTEMAKELENNLQKKVEPFNENDVKAEIVLL